MTPRLVPLTLLVIGALVLMAVGCGPASSADEPLGASSADLLSANDKTAYLFFLGKGLTNFQSAGVVGNLDQESEMDPSVAQLGGGPGRGIAQWSVGGRWDTDKNDNVLAYAKTKGESSKSLQLQLEFVWYELTTFSGYGLAHLKSSTNVAAATVAFQTYYEGCGQCDQTLRIQYAQKTLAAYGSLTPPSALKGHLDGVSCTTGIGGWAQDPSSGASAIGVELFFDGTMNASSALGPVAAKAGDHRADLCGPLGSCNHGFSIGLPLAMQDGTTHKVYAYAVGAAGGSNDALIANAPLSIKCAPPAIPATTQTGVKRWVKSAAVLGAWKLGGVDRLDVAHEPKAAVDALMQGPDVPATPDVIQADDGSTEIFVVDGGERRLVSAQAASAWRFGKPLKTPAAQVAAMKQGDDWPSAPFVFEGEGAPQVWLLDSAPGQSLGPIPAPTGAQGDAADPGTSDPSSPAQAENGGAPSASAGGCATTSGAPRAPSGAWAILAGALFLLRRRRASHSRVTRRGRPSRRNPRPRRRPRRRPLRPS